MAQGFYTLEEAAGILGMSPEELSQKAQQHEVRAFADRGSWRFRAQDIDEMAQGAGSSFDSSSSAFDESSEYSSFEGSSEYGSSFEESSFEQSAFEESSFEQSAFEESSFEQSAFEESAFEESSEFEASSEFQSSEYSEYGGSSFDVSQVVEPEQEPGGNQTGGPDFNSGNPSELGTPTQLADPDFDPGLQKFEGSDQFDLSDEVTFEEQLNPIAPSGPLNLAPDSGDLEPTVGLNIGEGGFNMDLGGPPPLPAEEPMALDMGSSEFDLKPDSGVGQGDQLDLGAGAGAPAISGGSDVRLEMDQGSFEFDLKVDSSGRLDSGGGQGGGAPSTGVPGGDEEVQLDFDASTIDDSMLLVGEPKPDSDVRIEPVSMGGPAAGPDDLMRTEEIDLDAELRAAEDASLKRKSTAQPKTKPPGGAGTVIPDESGSPFELSEEDLQLPQGSKRGDTGMGSGSEFELTLAEDDDLLSPLNLGDDEDVDLGGPVPKSDLGSGRVELSGINLGRPADSGISLEKGAHSSDQVDFELTLDDESFSGPKTIRGAVSESDSEFELTIDDSGSLVAKGDEQYVFEDTDFDQPAVDDESGSQAVALDDSVDLESSDFDLAIDDSSSQLTADDDSASEVVAIDDEPSTDTGTTDSELGEIDSLFDEDLMAPEPEPEVAVEEEDEPAAATIPAAQADWGVMPVLLMAPCVIVMLVAGMMAYELLHGMWGYHQPSKPTGLLVSSLSDLFTGEESKN